MFVSDTEKLKFMVDVKNIKIYDNNIYTYLALIDKEKNTYTGPFEFIINCQTQSYTLNKSHTPQWKNTSAGGVAALVLCGDVDKVSGDKYEFLFSFFSEQHKLFIHQYWVPKDVFSDLSNPNILIVKFFYSPLIPLNFSISNGVITGALAEIDCTNLKIRSTFGVVGSINIDSSKEWGGLSADSVIYSRICINKDLLVKQAAKPLQTNTTSIESSKLKCEELGFKPATEGFGKCVLQLTK